MSETRWPASPGSPGRGRWGRAKGSVSTAWSGSPPGPTLTSGRSQEEEYCNTSDHLLPSRQSAVLHWFHNQRLIDPDAGREVGGVRKRICSELGPIPIVAKHKTDNTPA